MVVGSGSRSPPGRLAPAADDAVGGGQNPVAASLGRGPPPTGTGAGVGAAMRLRRLWQQGKRDEARELLAPIYGWFTEGFDTADLQEAKTLLEELT
jgi:hypothetical protein